MFSQWFNTDLLDKQELQVTLQTQERFGRGRNGFCDFSRDGIDLLLQGIDLVNTAFAGHYGYNGKKFKVTYITMFNSVAPGLYEFYRILCDMAHGSFAAHALKIAEQDYKQKILILDDGLIFKLKESTYVINHYCPIISRIITIGYEIGNSCFATCFL